MKPIVLAILDGWGVNSDKRGNAILQAKTPFIDELEKFHPFLLLNSSGISVGLPWGESGNSEVGHMAIGTGRITYQYLIRIIFAIQNGSFFKNPVLLKAADHVKRHNSRLHIMGLVSTGTVHSYFDHLNALLDFAKKEEIKQVFVHTFSDGKDAPPREAKTFIPKFKKELETANLGKIATIMGRNFAMDRNQNWNLTKTAYETLTGGEKNAKMPDLTEHIIENYNQGQNDPVISPAIFEKNSRIAENDAVIFFNFREDSARQLTQAFVRDDFAGFERNKIKNLYFATMTKYEDDSPAEVLFEPPRITNSLSEVLSDNGKKQLKIAETEKYAHVTYFFNGLNEHPFKDETRIIIESITAANHEYYPKMRAEEITNRVISEIQKDYYDFILLNFANVDMLGHSGNMEKTIEAINFIDENLEKIRDITLKKDGVIIVSADHGNAEQMIHPISGHIETAHTMNPVPFYFVSRNSRKEKTSQGISDIKKEPQGLLSDIAPTILDIMQIPKPKEMSGKSLLRYLKSQI